MPNVTRRRFAGVIGPLLVAGALLAAAEIGLRVAGWHGPAVSVDPHANVTPLFHAADENGVRVLRRRDAPEKFLADKPSGALRVFVLGESSVAGTPYGTPYAFPASLQRRLAAAFPDEVVEVVNCGVAGLASWHVRRVADEIVTYRPDVIIIYTGQNDWVIRAPHERSLYGGRPRAAALARLRLYQLATVTAARLRPPLDPLDPRRTRDQREPFHAVEARITGWSTLTPADRRDVRRRFARNFFRILEAAKQSGALVVVSTLAQNLRDWPPSASRHAANLDDRARAAWEAAFERGETLRRAGDWTGALAAYDEARRIDDTPAVLTFARAQCLDSLGRWDEARAAYRRASDQDAAVLGVPSDFNRWLAKAAARSGATVVDLPAALEAGSPHGLLGRELFYDYVHPNLAGHQAIARVLADALRETRLSADWQEGEYQDPDPAVLLREHPELARQEALTSILVLLWAHRYDEALRTAKRSARTFPEMRRVYEDLRRKIDDDVRRDGHDS